MLSGFRKIPLEQCYSGKDSGELHFRAQKFFFVKDHMRPQAAFINSGIARYHSLKLNAGTFRAFQGRDKCFALQALQISEKLSNIPMTG